jgi:FkbM family methyltransferase
MRILRKAARHAYIPFYSIKLLIETLRIWGPAYWVKFWTSRSPNIPVELNGLRFLIRGDKAITKMTDTFAVLESVYHTLYTRKFYTQNFEIKPNYVVVDIGAYIGTFTVHAAKCAHKGVIISCEPEPSNFGQLEKNVALNGLKNVQAVKQAIAKKKGIAFLSVNAINPASNNTYFKSQRVIPVNTATLADIFSQFKLQHCNFLKLDCEGSEYEILMNLKPNLLNKIEKIACEYHNPEHYGISDPNSSPGKLIKFLLDNNFSVHAKKVNPYTGMIYAVNKAFKN